MEKFILALIEKAIDLKNYIQNETIKEFTSKNFIKNFCVHFLIGITVSLVSIFLCGFHPLNAIFMSLNTGITIEVCQYLYNDNLQPKIFDRIVDASTYWMGGMAVYLIIQGMR